MVKHISDRVGVMYLGTLVELSSSGELYQKPLHPYTQALLRSVPPVPGIGDLTGKDGEMVSAASLSGRLESIRGTVPEHYDRIKGCRFADRCPYREEACEKPQAETFAGPGHMVRCWKKEAL